MSDSGLPSSRRRRLIFLVLLFLISIPSAIFLGPKLMITARRALRPPDITIIPRDTSVMFTLDLAHLRKTPIWKSLLEVLKNSGDAEAAFRALATDTGFNPITDVDTVVGVFPKLGAGSVEDFGLVMQGESYKPNRFEEWSRGALAKDKKELLSRDYKGRKLLWDNSQPGKVITFDGDGTFLVGTPKWIESIIDLQSRPARTAPDAVVPLLPRVHKDWVFWGAGEVPEFIREKIRMDANFPTAATMSAAYLSVNFDAGLALAGGALLGTPEDALMLVEQLNALAEVMRKSDQVQAAGLGYVFAAIKVEAKGREVAVAIDLQPEQVADLIGRLKAVLARPQTKLPTQVPPQSYPDVLPGQSPAGSAAPR